MTFVIRKLNEGKTLAEKLHAMRKSANLTLSELCDRTKIQRKYLEAFEQGDYDTLPEPLYARQFLKRYVQELGGDVEYYLQCLEEEYGTAPKTQTPQTQKHTQRFWHGWSVNKILKISTLILTGVAITGYIGWQIQSLIAPPGIVIEQPRDGMITHRATLTIKGTSEKEANLQINGDPVLLSSDGTFKKEVTLQRGVNVITVKGEKRYSKTATIQRRVVLDKLQDEKTANTHGGSSNTP